jgi:nickel-type superoxide dismutase maturation protease
MAHLPFRAIVVSGNSMSPTFHDGDWLLFRPYTGVSAEVLRSLVGKVVVIERESYPGILFIKRIVRVDQSGIWVEGDNSQASSDSRQWGALSPEEIIGRVLVRYKRAKS